MIHTSLLNTASDSFGLDLASFCFVSVGQMLAFDLEYMLKEKACQVPKLPTFGGNKNFFDEI